jgi:hypothetical protein
MNTVGCTLVEASSRRSKASTVTLVVLNTWIFHSEPSRLVIEDFCSSLVHELLVVRWWSHHLEALEHFNGDIDGLEYLYLSFRTLNTGHRRCCEFHDWRLKHLEKNTSRLLDRI